jgi:hypothetical protein
MKFRIALTAAAMLAIAACGSAEEASTEAEADTGEIAADEALEGVDEVPVEDAGANAVATDEAEAEAAATEADQIQEAGDDAADTAAAAMDAMAEETN